MRYLTPLLICAAVVGRTTRAQLPAGAFALSSFDPGPGGTTAGPGGVFVVDPRIPGPAREITGLGIELTGPSLLGPLGAHGIAVRQSDGALLVGEIGPAGSRIDLHEITIDAQLNVVNDTTYALGIAGPGGAVVWQLAMLPEEDVFVCVDGLVAGPPLRGAKLARVTRDGRVLPLLLSGFSGDPGSLAVSRDGTTGYLGSRGPASRIYAFDPARGGAARIVASTASDLLALAVDGRGTLLAASAQHGGEIVSIDPGTGAALSRAFVGPSPTALQVERATDQPIYGLDGAGPFGHEVGWLDPGGGTTVLTSSLRGSIHGVDLRDNPRLYGRSSPGSVDYRWNHSSIPDALPRVGNSGFELSLTASSGAGAVGALIASESEGSFRLLGVDVLLDPATLVPVGFIPGSGPVAIPVPQNSMIGLSLNFQSFHLDLGAPNGIAGSNGVCVTVMR